MASSRPAAPRRGDSLLSPAFRPLWVLTFLVYGFVCLSALYVCRAVPASPGHAVAVVAAATTSAVVGGIVWLALASGWRAAIAPLVAADSPPGTSVTARLPLDVTVHTDRFNEDGLREKIDAYDQRRHALFPLRKQRHAQLYPDAPFNGWSEDKARHYSVPERADFGAFIREKKFSLK